MSASIKALIGLGNPDACHEFNRHNIGFMVVDALAQKYDGSWRNNSNLSHCVINIQDSPVHLIKPLTYMNSSGTIAPWLTKKGFTPEQLLVIHDELELPFGNVSLKKGGGARGHNGLRSLIQNIGQDFWRVRCGIGRPEQKSDVAHYVLSDFIEGDATVNKMIDDAVKLCITAVSKKEELA